MTDAPHQKALGSPDRVKIALNRFELMILDAALSAWNPEADAVDDQECRDSLRRWIQMADGVIAHRGDEEALANR